MSFNYDIDGVRSSKTKDNTTIDYTTDKNRDYAQVVLEKQNNQTVASYTYGDDLLSQTISTGTNFYGYDGLGSTKFLTDTNGAITDTYQYDAYGEITSKTGNTDNNYLYTGEQYDRSLNQYYLRARYYNQGVGRFTQMDTHPGYMSTPTTLNKYLYAGGNPVMHLDPSGRMFNINDVSATLRVFSSQVSKTSATSAGTIKQVLVGSGKEAYGILGQEVISVAKEALVKILIEQAAGTTYNGRGGKGTATHKEFEKLIKKISNKYEKYGYRIEAETFRNETGTGEFGRKSKRREKGSIGVDVAVISIATGKTVLAFDLKTGRGSSNKRNGRLSSVFNGTDIIDILVTKKSK